jgi:hypothetical protein
MSEENVVVSCPIAENLSFSKYAYTPKYETAIIFIIVFEKFLYIYFTFILLVLAI